MEGARGVLRIGKVVFDFKYIVAFLLLNLLVPSSVF